MRAEEESCRESELSRVEAEDANAAVDGRRSVGGEEREDDEKEEENESESESESGDADSERDVEARAKEENGRMRLEVVWRRGGGDALKSRDLLAVVTVVGIVGVVRLN